MGCQPWPPCATNTSPPSMGCLTNKEQLSINGRATHEWFKSSSGLGLCYFKSCLGIWGRSHETSVAHEKLPFPSGCAVKKGSAVCRRGKQCLWVGRARAWSVHTWHLTLPTSLWGARPGAAGSRRRTPPPPPHTHTPTPRYHSQRTPGSTEGLVAFRWD